MYDQVARYYDLTHAELTADRAFVLARAAALGGPILELGCGTGRLLLPLAAAGFAVTGVDNSLAMLAHARARLGAAPAAVRARARLVAADMTRLALTGAFGLVLCPYNTAMHLTPAQLGRTLRGVRSLLRPSGRLLIDVANPLGVAATPPDRLLTLERVVAVPDEDGILVQQASSWLEADRQQLRITWLYDLSPAAGGPVQRTVVTAIYHYLFPHQWQLLLADAGFRTVNQWGGYEEEPFIAEADRLLLEVSPVP